MSGATAVNTDPRTTTDRTVLLEAARFVKACSLYPAGHDRVVESGGQLLGALEVAGLDREEQVRIVFRRNEAFVSGRRVEADHSLVGWLLGLTRRAQLGGVDFSREVSAEGLHRFAQAVVAGGLRGRTVTPFDEDGSVPGVRLLELSFAGIHTANPSAITPQSTIGLDTVVDGTASGDVVERLAADARVRSLLEGLQEQMARTQPADSEEVEIDLLPHLVAIVEEETGADPQTIHEHVVASLQSVSRMVSVQSGEAADNAATADSANLGLSRAAQAVAQRFFTRSEAPTLEHDDALPAGRPEDESIGSQLDSLLEEYQSLPDDGPRTIDLLESDIHWQLASIWIHLIAHPMREQTRSRAARRLKLLIDQQPDLELPELRAYADDGDDGERENVTAAISALLEHGLAAHLFAHHAVDQGMLAATFPAGFPEAVRALESGDREVIEVIRGALRLLSSDEMRTGVRRLVRAGQLDLSAILTLLGAGIPEVAPAFDDEALSDDSSVGSLMVRALRAAPLPEPEGAALRALPDQCIPPSFAADVTRSVLTQSDRRPVLAESARLLRDFVKYHAWSEEHAETCVDVVRALASFPTLETRQCLADTARHRLMGGEATRPVRRAAKQALSIVRRSPCA